MTLPLVFMLCIWVLLTMIIINITANDITLYNNLVFYEEPFKDIILLCVLDPTGLLPFENALHNFVTPFILFFYFF